MNRSLDLSVGGACLLVTLLMLAATMYAQEKTMIAFASWTCGALLVLGIIFTLTGLAKAPEEPLQPPAALATSAMIYVPVLADDTFYDALQTWLAGREDMRVEVGDNGILFALQAATGAQAMIVFVSGEKEQVAA